MDKKKKDKAMSIVPGTVIIVLALIIVFGLVFAWMYAMDLLFLPDFVKDFFGISDEDDGVSWNIGELQSAVKSGRDTASTTVTFDITQDNLKNAFIGAVKPEGVYVSGEISLYSDDAIYRQRLNIYRHGDKNRAELYGYQGSEVPVTYAVSSGGVMKVKDAESGEISTKKLADSIYFENEIGVPSLDEIIAVVERFPKENITFESDTETAESGFSDASAVSEESAVTDPDEITDCTISLLQTENGNVYFISFVWAAYGIREEYYISLEHRTVIYAETTMGGVRTYSYEAKLISHDSEVYASDSLYTLS